MVFLVSSLRQYAFQLVDCSLNGWCNSRCVKLALLSSRSYSFYLRFLSLFSSLFLSLFYLFLSRFHRSFYYSYFIFIIGSTVFVLVFIGVDHFYRGFISIFSVIFIEFIELFTRNKCLHRTHPLFRRTSPYAIITSALSRTRKQTNDKQVTMQLLSIKKRKNDCWWGGWLKNNMTKRTRYNG